MFNFSILSSPGLWETAGDARASAGPAVLPGGAGAVAVLSSSLAEAVSLWARCESLLGLQGRWLVEARGGERGCV